MIEAFGSWERRVDEIVYVVGATCRCDQHEYIAAIIPAVMVDLAIDGISVLTLTGEQLLQRFRAQHPELAA